jgi:hypothetical protein
MARANSGTTLLFWLMLFTGGAALFACLALPPWVELRGLREERDSARARIVELEEQLTRTGMQIEHLKNDPSYLERLAFTEFGIKPPNVEIIAIEARPATAAQPGPSPETKSNPPGGDDLAAALERATHTNPLVAVFVLEPSRPIVMAMSGVIMAIALVSLLRGRRTE